MLGTPDGDMESSGDDRWFLGALLVMAWGSLRWSDLQRLDLSSISASHDAIQKFFWRTKSSKQGMCFAFLEVDLRGSHWAEILFDELSSMRAQSPGQHYFLASHGRPMTYTVALAQFRRCLLCYGGVTADLAQRFTLHSLKTALLCWATTL